MAQNKIHTGCHQGKLASHCPLIVAIMSKWHCKRAVALEQELWLALGKAQELWPQEVALEVNLH